MYSVTVHIQSPQLGAVLDDLLKREGVKLIDFGLIIGERKPGQPPAMAKRKSPTEGRTQKELRKGKQKKLTALREIIARTIVEGAEFQPREISKLAEARGVTPGSFYGLIVDLTKMGELSRPREGYYRREKVK